MVVQLFFKSNYSANKKMSQKVPRTFVYRLYSRLEAVEFLKISAWDFFLLSNYLKKTSSKPYRFRGCSFRAKWELFYDCTYG